MSVFIKVILEDKHLWASDWYGFHSGSDSLLIERLHIDRLTIFSLTGDRWWMGHLKFGNRSCAWSPFNWFPIWFSVTCFWITSVVDCDKLRKPKGLQRPSSLTREEKFAYAAHCKSGWPQVGQHLNAHIQVQVEESGLKLIINRA